MSGQVHSGFGILNKLENAKGEKKAKRGRKKKVADEPKPQPVTEPEPDHSTQEAINRAWLSLDNDAIWENIGGIDLV